MSQMNESVDGSNLEPMIIEEARPEETVEGRIDIIPGSHTLEMGRGNGHRDYYRSPIRNNNWSPSLYRDSRRDSGDYYDRRRDHERRESSGKRRG